ncbi:MAG: homocysteine S-methyltransferase family protein [Clostridia bacterium]
MIKKLLKEKDFIILDGATGTMLQKSGLKLGELPELLNFSQPDLIKSIQEAYLKAGSDIIYANTFGANAHKMENSGKTVTEIITQAVSLSKEVAKKYDKYVALDVGPIGELLEPSGTLSFEEAYEIFKEVVIAGEKAGADLVVFETMTDLYEVKAGVLACKENTNLPVFVTMTFEENGRTFTGCGIENMAMTLEGLGVDAIGINCSLGPAEILPLISKLIKNTSLPVIAKANAGLPDHNGNYNILANEFADYMEEYAKIGVKIIGGCCGSTDEFIKLICEKIADIKYIKPAYTTKTRCCSATQVVDVDTVRVIGERINPTGKKRFQQALKDGEISYILSQALEQVEAGADILDVNVGIPEHDEVGLMKTVVKAVQGIVSTPLQIDSSKFDALEMGLRVYNGKPILNSVNGEDEKLDQILPLAKKYGACVVGLTIDEDGIPKTAQKRVEIAKKILDKALFYGLPKEDVLIDCLTLTVSAQQKDCFETLSAMNTIKNELGLELVLGVSNISFGLPNRNLINHSFLTLAMSNGLTLPILNPNSESMMDAVRAYKVLSAYDVDSQDFISHYGNKKAETTTITTTSNMSLEDAVIKGMVDIAREQTAILIKTTAPLDIVNNILIPTLDVVGEKFEKGEFFLPQLIRTAQASLGAFDIIKTEIAKTSTESISKGTIILATVKGDVHDIGKNIVKVILENYGFKIIDLGKDVDPKLIVDTAILHDVKLVGLSALMTTTVESMKLTIKMLNEAKPDCKIVVGGAVLTHEYAMKIGADFYAKDAKKSADIAKEVLK